MKETNWKIDGYTSAAIALRSAERRGEVGLKGSGQECGPVCMGGVVGCRGWVYCTWDKRYLIPHGELSHEAMCKIEDL
jgi:hypothetical protein